jgi:hypothetical protein
LAREVVVGVDAKLGLDEVTTMQDRLSSMVAEPRPTRRPRSPRRHSSCS